MVWGAISKSWKSHLIFVKEGVKVNTDSYVNDILTPALASMKEKFKNKSFTFQQDGAPSHTSKKTQKWCEEHFPSFWTKDLWPPSLPNLNPMDFCVWGILEKEACSSPHNNLEDLRASLKQAWEKIPQDALHAACQNFRQSSNVLLIQMGVILNKPDFFMFMELCSITTINLLLI